MNYKIKCVESKKKKIYLVPIHTSVDCSVFTHLHFSVGLAALSSLISDFFVYWTLAFCLANVTQHFFYFAVYWLLFTEFQMIFPYKCLHSSLVVHLVASNFYDILKMPTSSCFLLIHLWFRWITKNSLKSLI